MAIILIIGFIVLCLIVWQNSSDKKSREKRWAERARRAANGDVEAKREIAAEESYDPSDDPSSIEDIL
jgi:hypothetical protein